MVTAALAILPISGMGAATASSAAPGGPGQPSIEHAPSAVATMASMHTPPQLAVPEGNTLVAVFPADGVQTYQCGNDRTLTLLEPAAVLSDRRGRPRALHSRGPTWVSTDDGSAVNASPVANAPVPGAVPELLLKATANRGDGVFGKVSYVQRLHTRGGVQPAGPCQPGSQVSVPYSAVYAFYAPASAEPDASMTA